MIGLIGKGIIFAAFATSILAALGYLLSDLKDDDRLFKISGYLYGLKGLLILVASGIVVYLIFTHQFQYYYVFNHTSRDLQTRYLISAFYGGQEGSFMLWIIWSSVVGLALMKLTKEPYRKPVMFVMALTQVFLISMIVGLNVGFIHLGSSPFRTLAEAMPNAPFLQSNPDFVPADGKGLNDLLKSFWMLIHPPFLFFGFAMMTVPFAFAMAALWKRRYNEWVSPALPWTLVSNLCLITAIFLGGYWAYVTLSFGGYWAWDPVENASFVPWLFGTAGIHAMIIQRKSSTSQKASFLLIILSYLAVVYETFLTRSGILADSSVHSFVDLGLYNQLVVFMVVISGLGLGLFFYRYKDLPDQKREIGFLTREFMTFAGAFILLLIGLVIILGTSSPIIGRLFVANPTPPAVSYYNQWSMPLAIVAAIFTVLGQYLFWKRYDGEALSAALISPLLVTSVVSLAIIMYAGIYHIYYMVYIFAAVFAVIGNAFVMGRLIRQNPKVIGGTLAHIGFGVLLLGIIASSAYNSILLDTDTVAYNKAVDQGKVMGDNGMAETQKIKLLELKLNEPKLVNDKYMVTYEGLSLKQKGRPGTQTYRLKFEDPQGNWDPFYMYPIVYPMLSGSMGPNVQWSVEPDVRAGLTSDIYLYVAGSSYVEQKNKMMKEQSKKAQPVSQQMVDGEPADSSSAEEPTRTITLSKGESTTYGGYTFTFDSYNKADREKLPENTMIGVRAQVNIKHDVSGEQVAIQPLFAIVKKGNDSWTFSPPVSIDSWNMDVQFSKVDPKTGKINLQIKGLPKKPEKAWVLVSAEEKPFISIVWFGIYILMGGFLVSIYRHAGRYREKVKTA